MDITFQEYEFKSEKVKESVLLVKQKMCKTHDLIKQYTDKVKEADCLKSDLEIAKKDARHMTCNYSSMLTKTRELELNITEVKQKNCGLINKIDECEITIAADKKNIQQLTCKIKDMEEKHSIEAVEYNLQKSSLENKIKDLEHELKISRKSEIKKGKKKIISADDTRKLNMETKSSMDIDVDVSMCKNGLDTKPEVQEKSVMTDEFYNIKDDPYPLFCTNCEVHLYPPPIKRISDMMSIYPELIPLSPSPPLLLPGTHLDSDRNENIAPSELLSVPCLASAHSEYSNITDNSIFQPENVSMPLSSENIELREETNHITYNTIVTNPSSNSDLVSATKFSPLQNKKNFATEDHYSSNLTANYNVSIKKIEGKMQSLKSKMRKQLYKLKKKLDANCHRCITSCNNNAVSLNPTLFMDICKNMTRLHNEDRVFFKNMTEIKSGNFKHSLNKVKLKRRKRLKKHETFKSGSSWKVEHINEKYSQNSLCNVTECTMDTTNITEPEHDLLFKNKNNPISNLDIPNKFFNNTDKSNKESLPCLTEETLIEDNLMTLHSNMSNNLLNNDEIQLVSSNCQITTEATLSCSNENSTDLRDKIPGMIVEENRIENKGKTDSCFLKRMNLMRRNEETDLHINDRNNIEVQPNCNSEYYEPARKRQIPHAKKASLPVESAHVPAVSKFNKCDDVPVEVRRISDVSIESITTEMLDDCNEPNVLINNIISDNDNNGIVSDILGDSKLDRLESSKMTHVINQSTSPCKHPQYESTKDLQAEIIEGTERETSIVKAGYDLRKVRNNKVDVSKDVSEVSEFLLENSLLLKDSRIVEDDNNASKFHDGTRSEIGKACVDNGAAEILNIEIQSGNACANQKDETKSICDADSNIEIQTPASQLYRYINDKNVTRKLPCKEIINAQKIIDEFVKQQLQRLTDNDWNDSVHYDVIEKLKSTCKPRIIAKCIVEFLSEYSEYDYALDRSFTPPAPLMATFQQKIIALLIDLQVSDPTTVSFVQAGIEYKLFQLNSKLQISEIDSLTRTYVALARIQNDRERIGIMCCDALYCMGFRAITILFTVLTCWPDILPNSDADKGILPKCIAFLLNSHKSDGTYPKLLPLKRLISSYYKYTQQVAVEDFIKELLDALKTKHHDGLDTAIILIAKRQGTSWTYKTIVQPTLLPMIINYEHICIYKAFSLLGKLLRTFPLRANDNIVKEITTQLSDLLESNEGSYDQQEGITSALLSLSRHEPHIVAKSVMKWTPNKPLRRSTITQIEAFIKMHSPCFWKRYMQTKM